MTKSILLARSFGLLIIMFVFLIISAVSVSSHDGLPKALSKDNTSMQKVKQKKNLETGENIDEGQLCSNLSEFKPLIAMKKTQSDHQWGPKNDSIFGVHNIDISTTKTQFQQLATAGVKTLRSNAAAWHRIERVRDKFNWRASDYVVNQAKTHNMQVMFALIAPPHWASAKPAGMPGPHHLAMVNDLNAWERYCRTVLTRYKGVVQYWEIWNEQNAPKTWFKGGTARDFVKIAEIAYKTSKVIDPNNVIIMGGVVGPEGEYKHQGKGFFENTLKLGISRWVDVYGIHYTAKHFKKYKWFRALIKRNGDPGKPIWNTEENYRVMPEDVAKVFLIDHFVQGMDKIIYFVVKDIRNPKGRMLRDGLFDHKGRPKTELAAYTQTTRFLKDKRFIGVIVRKGLFCFVFTSDSNLNTLNFALWSANKKGSTSSQSKNYYGDTAKGSNFSSRIWTLPGNVIKCQVLDAFGKPIGNFVRGSSPIKIRIGYRLVYVHCQVDQQTKAIKDLRLLGMTDMRKP